MAGAVGSGASASAATATCGYLLTHGARAVLVTAARRRRAGQSLSRLHEWALKVRDRCGYNKATLAVANKLARIVWAVWTRDVAFAA